MGLTQIFTNAWGKELCQLPLLVTICKLPLNYTLVVDQRSMKRGYARRLDGELLVRPLLVSGILYLIFCPRSATGLF